MNISSSDDVGQRISFDAAGSVDIELLRDIKACIDDALVNKRSLSALQSRMSAALNREIESNRSLLDFW